MAKRTTCSPELIITKLREAEVYLSQRKTVGQACIALQIIYYRWRREYGGMNSTLVGKLKEMEKEDTQLKKLVVDLSLNNAILKEVLGKK